MFIAFQITLLLNARPRNTNSCIEQEKEKKIIVTRMRVNGVGLEVILETGAMCELLLAHAALVRFFARVYAIVVDQIALVCE